MSVEFYHKSIEEYRKLINRSNIAIIESTQQMIKIRNNSCYVKDMISCIPYKELNTQCLAGRRQTGRTTTIKQVFDPTVDYYVANSMIGAKELIKPTYNICTGDIIYEMPKESVDIILKRSCLKSMRSDLRWVSSIDPSKYCTIYLDVCSNEVQENREYVHKVQEQIEKTFDEKQRAKILIVYT